MFDLEKSISEWREQMLAAGIKSPVPLEELEVHLREEIERQTKSGTDARFAFENAVKKIGQGKSLEKEFQKTTAFTYQRAVSVIMGIFVCGCGLRLCFGLATQIRGWEKWPDAEVIGMYIVSYILLLMLMTSGLILVGYGGKNFPWLPNKRKT